MNNKEQLNKAYIKNAIQEMAEIGKRALEYSKALETTHLDVEQEALIKNFSREFNHTFSQVEIKK